MLHDVRFPNESEEYRTARDRLLTEEIELRRKTEAVAAMRRELPLGGEDPLGRHALCFTGRHPDSGRRFELVTLPDGCAFDLLGVSG